MYVNIFLIIFIKYIHPFCGLVWKKMHTYVVPKECTALGSHSWPVLSCIFIKMQPNTQRYKFPLAVVSEVFVEKIQLVK